MKFNALVLDSQVPSLEKAHPCAVSHAVTCGCASAWLSTGHGFIGPGAMKWRGRSSKACMDTYSAGSRSWSIQYGRRLDAGEYHFFPMRLPLLDFPLFHNIQSYFVSDGVQSLEIDIKRRSITLIRDLY